MQPTGFATMAFGMIVLMIAVGLTNSPLHLLLVFTGFILFNLLMNAGPNSTTFTLPPILFPTPLRANRKWLRRERSQARCDCRCFHSADFEK